MRRIDLPPEMDQRTCNYCDGPLVRRSDEAPKHWVARKFCGRVCQGKARAIDRVVRFWQRVEQRSAEECWPWTGVRSERGYGVHAIAGKTYRAHRYALEVSGASLPPGCVVMHLCDNPPCCNPAHLRVGTHAENNADMRAKGRDRQLVGQDNPNTKLTVEQRREIRSRAGENLRVLAAEFGVAKSTAWRILREAGDA